MTAYLKSNETDEYKIDRFKSAEELLERITEREYLPDLLLLDIFMSGKTGVEAAEELRRQESAESETAGYQYPQTWRS